ncbi:MAG: efflux RND transporter periplasmic adaptor subunit [Phycisphaerales bacterium]|nr:efflux RND transporter periplasmic adaptor subunit [Phycisphaerales bacterium]MCI0674464.1 efflux RND transporter periplasmic adaptor subunit [Phycisphaerales bacterium]
MSAAPIISQSSKSRRGWIQGSLLLVSLIAIGVALGAWKAASLERANAASSNQPEPVEFVTVAVAAPREYRPTTTAIGTVLALQSITLRNELPGTVRQVNLNPGQIVEPGTVLVALDVSVEQAELKAQEAQAALTETQLGRVDRAHQNQAVSQMEVDRARAERDVALAQIERLKAIIARKTILAPFRATIGISDVHIGQYLNEGTQLTTLQGVDAAAHVDFSVAQWVSAALREGDVVKVFPTGADSAIDARIVAIDARVDPATRNAIVRARIDRSADDPRPGSPVPGASVRVVVPVGAPRTAVAIPVSALRKGPGGDHVLVIEPDDHGKMRAHTRAVQSDSATGDSVLIAAGLSVGEQVAASGSFKLRDGSLVVIAGDKVASTGPSTNHN